jgi:hypothetical protein
MGQGADGRTKAETLPNWQLEICEVDGRSSFEGFVRELPQYEQLVLDVAIRAVLAREGTNVCDTEWGKALGKGLYEFRVRRSLQTICNEAGVGVPDNVAAHQPVLLRVFFSTHGRRIILLIGGYDKQRDASTRRQRSEIERARKVLTAFIEAEKRQRKRRR